MEAQRKPNDLMIPVDDAINKFYSHLLACPRTILSARFGDGKTYFVDKFMRDESVQRTFHCIKLYPVNYQVTGNKDIFELIKRDILVQLLLDGIIEEDIHIDSNILMSFFYQNGKQDILETLVDFMAPLATASSKTIDVFGVLSGLRILQFMTNKFEVYKKKLSRGEIVKQFIEAQDKKHIYEQDATTCIIREVLNAYHDRYNKRVVLFIEDMDRLDPAHLFRIMNVLSAHMDYEYKHYLSEEERLYSNKFNIDNIVLVMDYRNAEKIFHHFYGQDTDYHGYIEKFCSGGYFHYSLAENKIQYVYEQIACQLSIPIDVIKLVLPIQLFDNKTVREIKEALKELDSLLIEKPNYNSGNKNIYLHLGFLKLLIVYKKLGIKEDEIAHILYRVSRYKPESILDYVGGYILLRNDGQNSANIYLLSQYGKDNSIGNNLITIKDINEQGLAVYEMTSVTNSNKNRFDIEELIHYLYEHYITPVVIEV